MESVQKYLKITGRFRKGLRNSFSSVSQGLRNDPTAWFNCLQMAITSLFRLWFAHYLKCWTPDFPSFEMIYSMYTMDSTKCSKFVLQLLSFWISHNMRRFLIAMRNCWLLDFFCDSLPSISLLAWKPICKVWKNSPSFLACFNGQKATKNTKTSQKLIRNICKGP